MKRLLIVLFSLVYSVNGAWAEDLYGLSAISNGGQLYIHKDNLSKGTSELLEVIPNHDGYGSGTSWIDAENGLFYAPFEVEGEGTKITIYDYINDTYTQTVAQANGYAKFALPYGTVTKGSAIISSGTDSDGNATTVVGSSNIVDSNGKTMIETKADGSVHIGENSLVTKEVNGAQSLYATDASGSAIPININNGSSLQINGVDVMDKIDGTVALSSAMSALPNSSEDATSTCGMGTGFHKGLSAISAGCAMDFSTLTQNENLSPLFKRASVNLGTSAIMNSSGFSNFALRAGLTFKLGAKKSSGMDLSMDEDLQRYSTGTNTRIAKLQKENDALKAEMDALKSNQQNEMDALNAKLDALIASLNNG
jgi:hypothetical protein